MMGSAQRRSPAAGRPARIRLAALERLVEVRAAWSCSWLEQRLRGPHLAS